MSVNLALIVEGHGEKESVPILVRRIASGIDPGLTVNIPHPIRVPSSRLIKAGELERTIELAALKIERNGGILVLLDCDWENSCPATDGPQLLERATDSRPDIPIAVVLARQEYEAWFIAAIESLRGKRGLPADVIAAPDPEGIRGAKEWIGARMGRRYSETLDQPALTAEFDINEARRSDSFDKCYREIRKLLALLISLPIS